METQWCCCVNISEQSAGVLLISARKCRSARLCSANLVNRSSRHAVSYYQFVLLWTFIGTVVIRYFRLSLSLTCRLELVSLRRALGSRKAFLVHELAAIFPITSDGMHSHSIASTPLLLAAGVSDSIVYFRWLGSEMWTGADEETVAAALGIVALVVSQLFQYLLVSPRFPVRCLASRSVIRDPTTNQRCGDRCAFCLSHQSCRYPLYLKGSQKADFQMGVKLLSKDVKQVQLSKRVNVVISSLIQTATYVTRCPRRNVQ